METQHEEPPRGRKEVLPAGGTLAVASQKAKILVCEDNVALSGVVCFNLVRAGFQVTTVGNGRLALDAVQKDTFDLILSDQQMPMMTGIQLCESIRELPAYRRTPFILLTAKCMEIDFAKLQQTLNISAALPKPFSPSELISCIEETLAAGCRA
jgi:two-component system, chemotaxis family, chemotaxis protein CheY